MDVVWVPGICAIIFGRVIKQSFYQRSSDLSVSRSCDARLV